MIVQCDKCSTRFKISDNKIKGKVVRIRCARCHQPFTVRGEEPEVEKEPANEAPLNNATDLNDPNDGPSMPENDDFDAPSLEYKTDSTTDLSLNDIKKDPDEDPDADLSDAAPDKPDEIDKTGQNGPAASPSGLSIDEPLGENLSPGDRSPEDLSGGEIKTRAEQPPEDNGCEQGLSMELNSDSVLVDGGEIGTPDSGDFSPDDFDLDPNTDEDTDAFTTDKFVPEDAPPEDIIEDGEDSVEFDLGIGTGITIDPDLDDDGKERPFESSIEDTLEESGFGFSLEGSPNDTEEDFTMDIDEFPMLREDEDSEFKTELPGFETELDPEFDAGPGGKLKSDLLPDRSEIKLTDTYQTEDGKADSDEPLANEPVADETGDETDIEDFATGLSPEDGEDTDDGFDLPKVSEPEDETEDGFALTEETESESETGGDFMVATEPTPENEGVFKGFADEPINDEVNETCEANEPPEPFEAPQPCTAEIDAPEEETLGIDTDRPYAREDAAPSEPAKEPIEANYNPQQPLPFETPSSPRPEMTFTRTPQEDDSGERPTAQTDAAGKKGANFGWLPLILLAIIVYGGIGALYSLGVIGPPQSGTVELSPIRVERIRGVFIENKEMGRIFTIEGRIRNFSEEPQGISMIRGVLEDGQGRVIAAKKVTPGKIISREALKTITRNELRKQLSGVPGGSIPPKGSIPVMIIFTKLPQGFAGAGVEVYRR